MRRARILVVDDEPQNVEILERVLAVKGHQVVGAGSAEEGAQALRASAFDLVIMDLVLPGASGLQALAEFKTLTTAPIYIMSGQNDEDTRRDSLLLGAARFIPKPLDLAAMNALISELPETPA